MCFTAKAEGPLLFGRPANRTVKIKAITYGGWKVDYSTGALLIGAVINFSVLNIISKILLILLKSYVKLHAQKKVYFPLGL